MIGASFSWERQSLPNSVQHADNCQSLFLEAPTHQPHLSAYRCLTSIAAALSLASARHITLQPVIDLQPAMGALFWLWEWHFSRLPLKNG